MSEKSLALIGNASGQGAEGARNCSEAFSIRRLVAKQKFVLDAMTETAATAIATRFYPVPPFKSV